MLMKKCDFIFKEVKFFKTESETTGESPEEGAQVYLVGGDDSSPITLTFEDGGEQFKTLFEKEEGYTESDYKTLDKFINDVNEQILASSAEVTAVSKLVQFLRAAVRNAEVDPAREIQQLTAMRNALYATRQVDTLLPNILSRANNYEETLEFIETIRGRYKTIKQDPSTGTEKYTELDNLLSDVLSGSDGLIGAVEELDPTSPEWVKNFVLLDTSDIVLEALEERNRVYRGLKKSAAASEPDVESNVVKPAEKTVVDYDTSNVLYSLKDESLRYSLEDFAVLDSPELIPQGAASFTIDAGNTVDQFSTLSHVIFIGGEYRYRVVKFQGQTPGDRLRDMGLYMNRMQSLVEDTMAKTSRTQLRAMAQGASTISKYKGTPTIVFHTGFLDKKNINLTEEETSKLLATKKILQKKVFDRSYQTEAGNLEETGFGYLDSGDFKGLVGFNPEEGALVPMRGDGKFYLEHTKSYDNLFPLGEDHYTSVGGKDSNRYTIKYKEGKAEIDMGVIRKEYTEDAKGIAPYRLFDTPQETQAEKVLKGLLGDNTDQAILGERLKFNPVVRPAMTGIMYGDRSTLKTLREAREKEGSLSSMYVFSNNDLSISAGTTQQNRTFRLDGEQGRSSLAGRAFVFFSKDKEAFPTQESVDLLVDTIVAKAKSTEEIAQQLFHRRDIQPLVLNTTKQGLSFDDYAQATAAQWNGGTPYKGEDDLTIQTADISYEEYIKNIIRNKYYRVASWTTNGMGILKGEDGSGKYINNTLFPEPFKYKEHTEEPYSFDKGNPKETNFLLDKALFGKPMQLQKNGAGIEANLLSGLESLFETQYLTYEYSPETGASLEVTPQTTVGAEGNFFNIKDAYDRAVREAKKNGTELDPSVSDLPYFSLPVGVLKGGMAKSLRAAGFTNKEINALTAAYNDLVYKKYKKVNNRGKSNRDVYTAPYRYDIINLLDKAKKKGVISSIPWNDLYMYYPPLNPSDRSEATKNQKLGIGKVPKEEVVDLYDLETKYGLTDLKDTPAVNLTIPINYLQSNVKGMPATNAPGGNADTTSTSTTEVTEEEDTVTVPTSMTIADKTLQKGGELSLNPQEGIDLLSSPDTLAQLKSMPEFVIKGGLNGTSNLLVTTEEIANVGEPTSEAAANFHNEVLSRIENTITSFIPESAKVLFADEGRIEFVDEGNDYTFSIRIDGDVTSKFSKKIKEGMTPEEVAKLVRTPNAFGRTRRGFPFTSKASLSALEDQTYDERENELQPFYITGLSKQKINEGFTNDVTDNTAYNQYDTRVSFTMSRADAADLYRARFGDSFGRYLSFREYTPELAGILGKVTATGATLMTNPKGNVDDHTAYHETIHLSMRMLDDKSRKDILDQARYYFDIEADKPQDYVEEFLAKKYPEIMYNYEPTLRQRVLSRLPIGVREFFMWLKDLWDSFKSIVNPGSSPYLSTYLQRLDAGMFRDFGMISENPNTMYNRLDPAQDAVVESNSVELYNQLNRVFSLGTKVKDGRVILDDSPEVLDVEDKLHASVVEPLYNLMFSNHARKKVNGQDNYSVMDISSAASILESQLKKQIEDDWERAVDNYYGNILAEEGIPDTEPDDTWSEKQVNRREEIEDLIDEAIDNPSILLDNYDSFDKFSPLGEARFRKLLITPVVFDLAGGREITSTPLNIISSHLFKGMSLTGITEDSGVDEADAPSNIDGHLANDKKFKMSKIAKMHIKMTPQYTLLKQENAETGRNDIYEARVGKTFVDPLISSVILEKAYLAAKSQFGTNLTYEHVGKALSDMFRFKGTDRELTREEDRIAYSLYRKFYGVGAEIDPQFLSSTGIPQDIKPISTFRILELAREGAKDGEIAGKYFGTKAQAAKTATVLSSIVSSIHKDMMSVSYDSSTDFTVAGAKKVERSNHLETSIDMLKNETQAKIADFLYGADLKSGRFLTEMKNASVSWTVDGNKIHIQDTARKEVIGTITLSPGKDGDTRLSIPTDNSAMERVFRTTLKSATKLPYKEVDAIAETYTSWKTLASQILTAGIADNVLAKPNEYGISKEDTGYKLLEKVKRENVGKAFDKNITYTKADMGKFERPFINFGTLKDMLSAVYSNKVTNSRVRTHNRRNQVVSLKNNKTNMMSRFFDYQALMDYKNDSEGIREQYAGNRFIYASQDARVTEISKMNVVKKGEVAKNTIELTTPEMAELLFNMAFSDLGKFEFKGDRIPGEISWMATTNSNKKSQHIFTLKGDNPFVSMNAKKDSTQFAKFNEKVAQTHNVYKSHFLTGTIPTVLQFVAENSKLKESLEKKEGIHIFKAEVLDENGKIKSPSSYLSADQSLDTGAAWQAFKNLVGEIDASLKEIYPDVVERSKVISQSMLRQGVDIAPAWGRDPDKVTEEQLKGKADFKIYRKSKDIAELRETISNPATIDDLFLGDALDMSHEDMVTYISVQADKEAKLLDHSGVTIEGIGKKRMDNSSTKGFLVQELPKHLQVPVDMRSDYAVADIQKNLLVKDILMNYHMDSVMFDQLVGTNPLYFKHLVDAAKRMINNKTGALMPDTSNPEGLQKNFNTLLIADDSMANKEAYVLSDDLKHDPQDLATAEWNEVDLASTEQLNAAALSNPISSLLLSMSFGDESVGKGAQKFGMYGEHELHKYAMSKLNNSLLDSSGQFALNMLRQMFGGKNSPIWREWSKARMDVLEDSDSLADAQEALNSGGFNVTFFNKWYLPNRNKTVADLAEEHPYMPTRQDPITGEEIPLAEDTMTIEERFFSLYTVPTSGSKIGVRAINDFTSEEDWIKTPQKSKELGFVLPLDQDVKNPTMAAPSQLNYIFTPLFENYKKTKDIYKSLADMTQTQMDKLDKDFYRNISKRMSEKDPTYRSILEMLNGNHISQGIAKLQISKDIEDGVIHIDEVKGMFHQKMYQILVNMSDATAVNADMAQAGIAADHPLIKSDILGAISSAVKANSTKRKVRGTRYTVVSSDKLARMVEIREKDENGNPGDILYRGDLQGVTQLKDADGVPLVQSYAVFTKNEQTARILNDVNAEDRYQIFKDGEWVNSGEDLIGTDLIDEGWTLMNTNSLESSKYHVSHHNLAFNKLYGSKSIQGSVDIPIYRPLEEDTPYGKEPKWGLSKDTISLSPGKDITDLSYTDERIDQGKEFIKGWLEATKRATYDDEAREYVNTYVDALQIAPMEIGISRDYLHMFNLPPKVQLGEILYAPKGETVSTVVGNKLKRYIQEGNVAKYGAMLDQADKLLSEGNTGALAALLDEVPNSSPAKRNAKILQTVLLGEEKEDFVFNNKVHGARLLGKPIPDSFEQVETPTGVKVWLEAGQTVKDAYQYEIFNGDEESLGFIYLENPDASVEEITESAQLQNAEKYADALWGSKTDVNAVTFYTADGAKIKTNRKVALDLPLSSRLEDIRREMIEDKRQPETIYADFKRRLDVQAIRIPTTGYNSNQYARVAFFFDGESNSIITPSYLQIPAGSDNDGDQISLHMRPGKEDHKLQKFQDVYDRINDAITDPLNYFRMLDPIGMEEIKVYAKEQVDFKKTKNQLGSNISVHSANMSGNDTIGTIIKTSQNILTRGANQKGTWKHDFSLNAEDVEMGKQFARKSGKMLVGKKGEFPKRLQKMNFFGRHYKSLLGGLDHVAFKDGSPIYDAEFHTATVGKELARYTKRKADMPKELSLAMELHEVVRTKKTKDGSAVSLAQLDAITKLKDTTLEHIQELAELDFIDAPSTPEEMEKAKLINQAKQVVDIVSDLVEDSSEPISYNLDGYKIRDTRGETVLYRTTPISTMKVTDAVAQASLDNAKEALLAKLSIVEPTWNLLAGALYVGMDVNEMFAMLNHSLLSTEIQEVQAKNSIYAKDSRGFQVTLQRQIANKLKALDEGTRTEAQAKEIAGLGNRISQEFVLETFLQNNIGSREFSRLIDSKTSNVPGDIIESYKYLLNFRKGNVGGAIDKLTSMEDEISTLKGQASLSPEEATRLEELENTLPDAMEAASSEERTLIQHEEAVLSGFGVLRDNAPFFLSSIATIKKFNELLTLGKTREEAADLLYSKLVNVGKGENLDVTQKLRVYSNNNLLHFEHNLNTHVRTEQEERETELALRSNDPGSYMDLDIDFDEKSLPKEDIDMLNQHKRHFYSRVWELSKIGEMLSAERDLSNLTTDGVQSDPVKNEVLLNKLVTLLGYNTGDLDTSIQTMMENNTELSPAEAKRLAIAEVMGTISDEDIVNEYEENRQEGDASVLSPGEIRDRKIAKIKGKSSEIEDIARRLQKERKAAIQSSVKKWSHKTINYRDYLMHNKAMQRVLKSFNTDKYYKSTYTVSGDSSLAAVKSAIKSLKKENIQEENTKSYFNEEDYIHQSLYFGAYYAKEGNEDLDRVVPFESLIPGEDADKYTQKHARLVNSLSEEEGQVAAYRKFKDSAQGSRQQLLVDLAELDLAKLEDRYTFIDKMNAYTSLLMDDAEVNNRINPDLRNFVKYLYISPNQDGNTRIKLNRSDQLDVGEKQVISNRFTRMKWRHSVNQNEDSRVEADLFSKALYNYAMLTTGLVRRRGSIAEVLDVGINKDFSDFLEGYKDFLSANRTNKELGEELHNVYYSQVLDKTPELLPQYRFTNMGPSYGGQAQENIHYVDEPGLFEHHGYIDNYDNWVAVDTFDIDYSDIRVLTAEQIMPDAYFSREGTRSVMSHKIPNKIAVKFEGHNNDVTSIVYKKYTVPVTLEDGTIIDSDVFVAQHTPSKSVVNSYGTDVSSDVEAPSDEEHIQNYEIKTFEEVKRTVMERAEEVAREVARSYYAAVDAIETAPEDKKAQAQAAAENILNRYDNVQSDVYAGASVSDIKWVSYKGTSLIVESPGEPDESMLSNEVIATKQCD